MRLIIRRLILACALVFGFLSLVRADLGAAQAERASFRRVGHTIRYITVPDSAVPGGSRWVEVHLWYPADNHANPKAPKARYASMLYGRPLLPQWDPLAWSVEAEIAREGVLIETSGRPFPVIVFSHGAQNDAMDYAFTMEEIAAEGFVVAAPNHTGNTADDVRIDFINTAAGVRLFPCNDGRPLVSPCARTNIPLSMKDRSRDITAVLDSMPAWFGDRADMSRVGVMGQSRGTVSALGAAGGSTTYGFGPDLRVKAVMGMAIGGPAITFSINLANITVPTLLVAGGLDANSPQAVSEAAYDALNSEKLFVSIEKAHHRTYASTGCAQTQSSAGFAQATIRAILDRQRAIGMLTNPIGGNAQDFCAFPTFTTPVDIRPFVFSTIGLNVTPENVPISGLETEEAKEFIKEISVEFFGTVLKREDDTLHFKHFLSPKWLEQHAPIVASAEAFEIANAHCSADQDGNEVGPCDD